MNGLIGSEQYEHFEENLMVGFRGCGRYIDPFFEECFLQSLELMIPFVHTWDMAKDANELLEPNGLKHGEDGLKAHCAVASSWPRSTCITLTASALEDTN